jgi:hypothetical protein
MNRLKQMIPTWLRTALGRSRYQAKKDAIRRQILADLPKGSIGAEIGVHEGDLSAEIIANVQPTTLHLIDPWKYQDDPAYRNALFGGAAAPDPQSGQAQMDARYARVLARFTQQAESGQVVFHRNFSQDVAAMFEDAYFDWVYIDGNHLYEFVKQDLTLYYPKIKPGGIVLGDDYNTAGWWEDGVTRAVDEFAAASGLTLTVTGSQFLIRKP